MRIRDADAATDGAACAAVYAPFVTDSVISFEYEAPSEAEFSRRIARLSETHAFFVAEDSGSVIGFAYGSQHRERAAYRWATEVSVYIAASHHRRGLGRALYRAVLERLAARGFRIALAGIALPNEASVALHEALGFEPLGIYRGIGWKFGRWWDVGWWQLQLDGGGPPEELR
jgi:L-amino acid N-acyltransferase YncA